MNNLSAEDMKMSKLTKYLIGLGLAAFGAFLGLVIYDNINEESRIIKKPGEEKIIHITSSPFFTIKRSADYKVRDLDGILKSITYVHSNYSHLGRLAIAVETEDGIGIFSYSPDCTRSNKAERFANRKFGKDELTDLVTEAKANIGNNIEIRLVNDRLQMIKFNPGNQYTATK